MKPTEKDVALWVDEACDKYMTQDAHFMYVAHAAYEAGRKAVIAEMEAGEPVAIISEALTALEVAQDNLRQHGDNCFLHDTGEYASCFCGKDSVSSYLQDVVEKLATAIGTHPQPKAEELQKAEPVANDGLSMQSKDWIGLTEDDLVAVMMECSGGPVARIPSGWRDMQRAIEAKLKEKNT